MLPSLSDFSARGEFFFPRRRAGPSAESQPADPPHGLRPEPRHIDHEGRHPKIKDPL